MASRLINDIHRKFFIEGGNRIVVVLNRDGVLCSDQFAQQFREECGIEVAMGSSLDLRLIKEISSVEQPGRRVLFVIQREFELLPDIADEVDYYEFQTKSLFRYYAWEEIKNESLHVLSKLYETPQASRLTAAETSSIVTQIKCMVSDSFAEYRVESYKLDISTDVDFNNPTTWINETAKVMAQSLESDKWNDLVERVDDINSRFQQFLADNYAMIQASGCPQNAPRIVTHIQPFLRRKQERCALVVVDGMNYWQGQMLMDSIKRNLGRDCSCDCIYSWLPSTTELSRQAIFKGARPDADYLQNPTNEKSLWMSYWRANGKMDYQLHYQHSGDVQHEYSAELIAYVNVELDEMMHNSKNYKYLYYNTSVWVNEKSTIAQIQRLLEHGYKVYITTDHGNIEGVPYKKLCTQEKLGATYSLRHISVSSAMDKGLFKEEHSGHLTQIARNNTFHPIGREIFHTDECVTHGGTHWLEVLIPFITIN